MFLALVGLTKVKVRSVRKKHGIGCIPQSDSDVTLVTLVGLTPVKGRSVRAFLIEINEFTGVAT